MEAFNSSNRSRNASTNELMNYKHTAIYATVFVILSVLIAVSNATVLLLYHINPRIRSIKNLLLASLALSDFCAGTVVLPITMKCFEEYKWNMCIASSVLFRFIAYSTILHILAIILEKYISILHPFYVVQKKHLRVVSGCIWSTSTMVAMVPLVWLHKGKPEDSDFIRKELIYFLVTFLVFFVTPFLLIVYAQIRMLTAISRSFSLVNKRATTPGSPVESLSLTSLHGQVIPQRDSLDSAESSRMSPTHNRKVLIAFALMLGTFTICWLTWYLGVFLAYVDNENFNNFSAALKQMTHLLVFMPSLINPLLYTYYKQDFRQALQALIKISLKTLCH